MPSRLVRLLLGGAALLSLLILFLFQGYDVAAHAGVTDAKWRFIINRLIRFLLNDSMVVVLIYALFVDRIMTRFAVLVQFLGFAFLLCPYLILKYHWPGYNGPLISFLHRLVVNPLLMLLLIPAFYLQQRRVK
jgi:exosortase F-associated protein